MKTPQVKAKPVEVKLYVGGKTPWMFRKVAVTQVSASRQRSSSCFETLSSVALLCPGNTPKEKHLRDRKQKMKMLLLKTGLTIYRVHFCLGSGIVLFLYFQRHFGKPAKL